MQSTIRLAYDNDDRMSIRSITEFSTQLGVDYDVYASRKLKQDVYRLTDGFKFYSGNKTSGVWVIADKGYLTTGAFLPKWARRWLMPKCAQGTAAIVHSLLTETGNTTAILKQGIPIPLSHAEANRLFDEAMRVVGVFYVKRKILFLAAEWYRLIRKKYRVKSDLKATLEHHYIR